MFQTLRRSTKWIIIVVVVAFVGTLLYVGGVNLFAGDRATVADTAVAEVNGQALGLAQLNSQVSYRIDMIQAQGGRVSGIARESVRYDALQDLIVQSLLQQAADEMDVSVDAAEVAQGVDAIRAQFPSNETYRSALREARMNEAQLRQQIQESLRLQQVQRQVIEDVQVTDEEIARAYEAVHLKQLVVQVQEDEEAAWEEAGEKAAALRERLVQGTSFEDAAEGDEQVTQSDLGFVERDATVPQAVLDAAFALKAGEVSEPVRTSNGYRILQAVEWRRPDGEAFEEEKESLRQELLAEKQQEAYATWLEERRSDAEITILDPALRAFDLLVAEDLEGAEAGFRQAIAADPQNAYLHAILAEVLAQQERLEEAVAEAEQAVALYERDPELHMLLGNLLREAERPDDAVTHYQKASELSPYDLQLHLTLFGIYLDMGRDEEAEAERAQLQEIQELLAERQRMQQELEEQLQQESEGSGEAGPSEEASSETPAGEPDAATPEGESGNEASPTDR